MDNVITALIFYPKWNKNLVKGQVTKNQKPMALELSQGRNANAVVVKGAAVDEEASRCEAPNSYLKALNFIFTTCIGPWSIAK
jgi:hypothetical protein